MLKNSAPISSRTEFISDDTINDGLRYSRNGGCFVTTKKAIAFVVFALTSLCIVIILMYYYGPNTRLPMVSRYKWVSYVTELWCFIQFQRESNDIEELLNETINEDISKVDLRLPTHVFPVHYKLKMHPILDEPRADNFTFQGHVKIMVTLSQFWRRWWTQLNYFRSTAPHPQIK